VRDEGNNKKERRNTMKRLALAVLVLAIISVPIIAEGDTEDTIARIDEQIASYTTRIDQATTNIEQGSLQLEQMRTQLQQLIGARYSLQELKQELLKENPPEESGENQGDAKE
jgi:hypothetical protein